MVYGTSFDGYPLNVTISELTNELTYIRYWWETSSGTASDKYSLTYPVYTETAFVPEWVRTGEIPSGVTSWNDLTDKPSGLSSFENDENYINSKTIVVNKIDFNDDVLYLKLQVSKDPTFSSNVLNIDTKSSESDRSRVKIFDGSIYVDFPVSGLGSTFDGFPVNVTISELTNELTYIRYWWETTDDIASDYYSLTYPTFSETSFVPEWVRTGEIPEVITSYNDLEDKPTIPSALSQLENDKGYISGYTETDPVYAAQSSQFVLKKDQIKKVSELENDKGYISGYTETDPIYAAQSGNFVLKANQIKKLSELENDTHFISSTVTDAENSNLAIEIDGSYISAKDTLNNINTSIKKDSITFYNYNNGNYYSQTIGFSSNGITLNGNDVNTANGLLKLDKDGKVPSANLPSYVDDVLEYSTSGDFPKSVTNDQSSYIGAGKSYIAKDTNISFSCNETIITNGMDGDTQLYKHTFQYVPIETTHSLSADIATKALSSDFATNAKNAEDADHADNADEANHALSADYADLADEANHADNADEATHATNADLATKASQLETSRTITLSGAVIGSYSFNGTTDLTVTTNLDKIYVLNIISENNNEKVNILNTQVNVYNGDSNLSSTLSADKLIFKTSEYTQTIGSTANGISLNGHDVNTANGLVKVNSEGKIPSGLLPEYVDDVLEYATSGDFPTSVITNSNSPEGAGKLYLAKDTSYSYLCNETIGSPVSGPNGTYLYEHTFTYTKTKTINAVEAEEALKLKTTRTISIAGVTSGSVSFDGSQDVTINTKFDKTSSLTFTNVDNSSYDGKSLIDYSGVKVSNNNETILSKLEKNKLTFASSSYSQAIAGTINGISLNGNDVNTANGLVKLDNDGLIPSSLIPDFLNDVLEYATSGDFPTVGESGILYLTDTNDGYRWNTFLNNNTLSGQYEKIIDSEIQNNVITGYMDFANNKFYNKEASNKYIFNSSTYSDGFYSNLRTNDYVIVNGHLYYIASMVNGSVSFQKITQDATLNNWRKIAFHQNICYGICNGYLYGFNASSDPLNAIQLGTENGWTDICGGTNSSGIYSFGIRAGKLYIFDGGNPLVAPQLLSTKTSTDELTGWTKVTGISSDSYVNSKLTYAYGICQGKIYYLSSSSGPVQIEDGDEEAGELSGWQDVTGFSEYSISPGTVKIAALGLKNGNIFYLYRSNAPQIVGSTSTTFTAIGGSLRLYSSSSTYGSPQQFAAYAIDSSGYLYRVYASSNSSSPTYSRLSSSSGWSDLGNYSGGYSSSYTGYFFSYALCNGELYNLCKSYTPQKIGTSDKWTQVYNNSHYYSKNLVTFGVCDGALYTIYNSSSSPYYGTVTKVSYDFATDSSFSDRTEIPHIPNVIYVDVGTNSQYFSYNKQYVAISGRDVVAKQNMANRLAYARKIELAGALSGEAYFDGSNDIVIETQLDYTSVITGYFKESENKFYDKLDDGTYIPQEQSNTFIFGNSLRQQIYSIANSYLYYSNGQSSFTKVGSLSGWTDVNAYSSTKAYGICNGYLYYLSSTSNPTQVGSLSGWTKVSCGRISTYQYGIREGYLYRLYGSNVTQIGSSNGWTQITGSSDMNGGAADYGIGICNGYLYRLGSNVAYQIGSSNGWTKITGYAYSAWYGYGICNGQLYKIYKYQNADPALSAQIIDSSSGWSDVYGVGYSSSNYAYAIKNGYLYSICNTTVTQIGSSSGWTKICGGYCYTTTYSYGICNGEVYALYRNTATKIEGISNCVNIGGASTSSYYAYAVANNKLYAIKQASAPVEVEFEFEAAPTELVYVGAKEITPGPQVLYIDATSGISYYYDGDSYESILASKSLITEKLETSRKIQVSGDLSGYQYFDGSSDVIINSELTQTIKNYLLNYNNFTNYPTISGVTIKGDLTIEDLGLDTIPAPRLKNARKIELSGVLSGSNTFDGSKDIVITADFNKVTKLEVHDDSSVLKAIYTNKIEPSGLVLDNAGVAGLMDQSKLTITSDEIKFNNNGTTTSIKGTSNGISLNGNDVNTANGLVKLDSNGKVDESILPSSVYNYNELNNLPKLNNTTLSGSLSLTDVGINLDNYALNSDFEVVENNYLSGITLNDGSKLTVTNHIVNIPLATTAKDGLLSKEDKIKINSLSNSSLSGIIINGVELTITNSTVTLPSATTSSDGLLTSADKSNIDKNTSLRNTKTISINKIEFEGAIFLKMEISTDPTFVSNVLSINTKTSSTDRNRIKVFDGSIYDDFPTSGLGPSYDGYPLNVTISELTENLTYIRYWWESSEGTTSDKFALTYPVYTETSFVPEWVKTANVSGEITTQGNEFNSAGNLVKLNDEGKIPSSLYDGGSGNSEDLENFLNIKHVSIIKIEHDDALQLHMEVSPSGDFSTISQTFDTSNQNDRNSVKVFNGDEFDEFPTSGIGQLYNDMPVDIYLSGLNSTKINYVRYYWYSENDDNTISSSDKFALIYPSFSEVAPVKTELENKVTELERLIEELSGKLTTVNTSLNNENEILENI